MKLVFTLMLLSLPAAAADLTALSIAQGEPCSLEGERAYVKNGEGDDVFVCENGKWDFLYTREPGEQD